MTNLIQSNMKTNVTGPTKVAGRFLASLVNLSSS